MKRTLQIVGWKSVPKHRTWCRNAGLGPMESHNGSVHKMSVVTIFAFRDGHKDLLSTNVYVCNYILLIIYEKASGHPWHPKTRVEKTIYQSVLTEPADLVESMTPKIFPPSIFKRYFHGTLILFTCQCITPSSPPPAYVAGCRMRVAFQRFSEDNDLYRGQVHEVIFYAPDGLFRTFFASGNPKKL